MFNILIVDDDANNLYSISALFEQGDFHIEQAIDGNEALKIIMEKPVDLVILDVQLPNYNGFQLAKMIKSRKSTQHIPIILASAVFKAQTFMEEGLEAGAVDYIIKPINGQILMSKVNHYRENRENFLELEKQIKFYKEIINQVCIDTDMLIQVYNKQLIYRNLVVENWTYGYLVPQETIKEIVDTTLVSGTGQSIKLEDDSDRIIYLKTNYFNHDENMYVLLIAHVQKKSL